MKPHIVISLFLTVLLAGCSIAESGPSKEQIKNAVNDRLPAGLEVQSMEFKVFPGENGSRGRVNIAGNIETTEDRVEFEARQSERLVQTLQSLGVTPNQAHRYLVLAGLRKQPGLLGIPAAFYLTREKAGTVVDFTSDLFYSETVNGYEFNGEVSYKVCCQSLSEVKKGKGLTLVYDTPAMQEQVEKLLTWHRHETETLPQKAGEIFGNLTAGAEIVDGDRVIAKLGPVDLHRKPWTVNDLASGKDNRYYRAYTAELPTTIELVSDTSIMGMVAERGKVAPAEVQLTMYYQNPRPESSCLSLRSSQPHPFKGPVCWSGAEWAWDGRQYGGIVTLTGNRQLRIRSAGKVSYKAENQGKNSTDNSEAAAVDKTKDTAQENIEKVKQEINLINEALNMYKLDNYVYPSEAQGLIALITKPTSPVPANWKADGYLKHLSSDPWGQPYKYRNPGKRGVIDLFSTGPDGVESNDDIGNW